MKSSAIVNALRILINARQSAFIWGSPGIGKSDTVRQVANMMGLELIDVRAILLDPVDLRGVPSIEGGKTIWNTPDFLPTDPNSKGILFLDELNAAPASVQAGCYQLVLDRKLGSYMLPENWVVIAAGNRETDRAVVNRMPSALANRFIHLDFETDLEDWSNWAINNDLPVELIAFLRFRPELLHCFDPKSQARAFPSPRSWSFVAKVIDGNEPNAIIAELIKGTVGDGASAEFMGFWKIFHKLPSPDAILMDPANAKIPKNDPATLYALCGALSRKASHSNFDRITTFASRLPAEFGVLLVRDSARRTPEVQNTKAFIHWASKNAEVMI